MSSFEKPVENVKFAAFGKKAVKDEKSYLIEKGQVLQGMIKQIKVSTKGYGRIYILKIAEIEEDLVITGKASLNNQLGYGNMGIEPVKEGDEVQITWTGFYKTDKGEGYAFDVLIKRN